MTCPAEITFARLSGIAPQDIIAHMSDPRMRAHMPLLTAPWGRPQYAEFLAAKEACRARDGPGHWAILCGGTYAGWGGFQKEGSEWDFGLDLRPGFFGLGPRVTRMALDFARADARIAFVTFLLPPSRRRLGALARLGAAFAGEAEHGGARFRKFRLETPPPGAVSDAGERRVLRSRERF